MNALGHIAAKGDAQAISAVRARLDNSGASFRRAAVNALQHIASKGDAQTIAVLRARQMDSIEGVRRPAVNALQHIASKGDVCIVAVVRARLLHSDGVVRSAAVHALRQIPEKGGAQTTAALHARLEDSDAGVRCAALNALPASTALRYPNNHGENGRVRTVALDCPCCPSCNRVNRQTAKFCDQFGTPLEELGTDLGGEYELIGFRIGSSLLHKSNADWAVLKEQIQSCQSKTVKDEVIDVCTDDIHFLHRSCSPQMRNGMTLAHLTSQLRDGDVDPLS